jgi:hypothetical protein
MAIISKGITLSYKAGTAGDFIELTNLQEIPELGGDSEAIEITTLADAAHMYTDGILSYGDTLTFKFLYEKEQFGALQELGEAEWKVELPDATTCTFGGTPTVKLDGVGVNAVLTYSLGIKPTSEMIWG